MIDPNDLLNTKFEKKMGGYKAANVDSFMIDAASLISQQTREIMEQRRRLDAAQQKINEYELDRNNLKEALLSAQRLAESIVRDARAKAEKIEKEAAGRANTLIGEMRSEIIAEQEKLLFVKSEVSDFRSVLLNMYRTHLELINDMPVFRKEEPLVQPQEEPETQVLPQPEAEDKKPEETGAEIALEQAAAAQTMQGDEAPEMPVPAKAEQADEPYESDPDVKLNVRFDEESGEYVPLAVHREKRHGEGTYNDRRR